MPKVFLCDTGGEARELSGRLGDRLRTAFGNRRIVTPTDPDPVNASKLVSQCDTLVIVLGDFREGGGDFPGAVRAALEYALRAGLLVIPVMMAGQKWPEAGCLPDEIQPVVYRNGVMIRHDPDFHTDASRLIRGILKPGSLVEPYNPDRVLLASLRNGRWQIMACAVGLPASILLAVFAARILQPLGGAAAGPVIGSIAVSLPGIFGAFNRRGAGIGGLALGFCMGYVVTIVWALAALFFMLIVCGIIDDIRGTGGFLRLTSMGEFGGMVIGILDGVAAGIFIGAAFAQRYGSSQPTSESANSAPRRVIQASCLGGLLGGVAGFAAGMVVQALTGQVDLMISSVLLPAGAMIGLIGALHRERRLRHS